MRGSDCHTSRRVPKPMGTLATRPIKWFYNLGSNRQKTEKRGARIAERGDDALPKYSANIERATRPMITAPLSRSRRAVMVKLPVYSSALSASVSSSSPLRPHPPTPQ